MIISALTAIRQEIDFYDKTVAKYSLPLDREEKEMNPVTGEYVALFEAADAKDAEMLKGLVVLWATERVCNVASFFRL